MKKIKLIKQHDERDCGAACLSMILGCYGRKISVSAAKQAIKVDRNGANIYGIMDGARQYRLTSDAFEGSSQEAWDNISSGEYSFPFIIRILNDHVYEHFVVAAGIEKRKLVIMDPAKGKRVLTKDEFSECFLGHVITFMPDQKFKVKNERKSDYTRYLHLITRQKKLLISTIVLSLGILAIGMSGMYLFRYIIDSVIGNLPYEDMLEENIESLCLLIFVIGVLYVVKYGLAVLRAKLMARLSQKIDLPLMLGYYNHVTELPLSFFNTLKTGEVMSRFEDASKIRDAISGSMITITLESFIVIGCGIVLYLQSHVLFRTALYIFIVYFIIAVLFVKPLAKSNEEVMVRNAKLISFLKESIDGIETVKATSSEKIVRDKTASIYMDLLKKGIRNGLLNTRKEALIDLVTSFGTLFVLWIGTMEVLEGNISVGTLITFTSLMSLFLNPIQDLVQLQGSIQTAVVAADRLNDILSIEKERLDGSVFETGVDQIDFDHIDFRYGNRELVLKDFSIKITRGQRIALIGESGCGKSTAAKLIMGLYTPEKGCIRVNGMPAEDCSIGYLRKQIAYVPQNTYLFSGTVRENLFMGAHDMEWSEDDIETVLDICQCQFIKKMPLGIDSEIEENGTNLSGGQKQRIAIARALLGNPSVLILDESTSALDAVAEYKILKSIRKHYPSISIITVTHRIRSIIDYDRIYVIENGCVSGVGVHKELVVSSSVYKELWDAQQSYYCQEAS